LSMRFDKLIILVAIFSTVKCSGSRVRCLKRRSGHRRTEKSFSRNTFEEKQKSGPSGRSLQRGEGGREKSLREGDARYSPGLRQDR
jgi:hypothetical protein